LSVNTKYKKYDDSLCIFEAQVSQTFLDDAIYYVEQACVRDDTKCKLRLEIQMDPEALMLGKWRRAFNVNKETRIDILQQLREYKAQLITKGRNNKHKQKQSKKDQVKEASDNDKPKDRYVVYNTNIYIYRSDVTNQDF